MDEISVAKVESDLKMFFAAALSGLLANPRTLTTEYQNYLRAKGLTTEKLALLSAMNSVEEFEAFKDTLKKPKPTLVQQ